MAFQDMFGGIPTEGLNAYDQGTQQAQGLQKGALDNQHMQALLAQKAAELPGIQAQSTQHQLAAQQAQALQPGTIRNKQQGMDNEYSQQQGAQLGILGGKLAQLGPILAQIPNTTTPAGNSRVMALQQMMPQLGLDGNHPLVKHLLSDTDPNDLPGRMNDLGSKISLAAADFQQKRALELDKTNALIENNKASNSSRETVAQIQADARIKAAQMAIQKAAAHANIEQKIGQLTSDPGWKNDPAKVAQYTDLMKSATVLRNAAANGYLNADMTDTASPNARAGDVIKDVTKPSTPTKPASTEITSDQVKQAFGEYEPDKYEYAVFGGTLHRKKK